MMTPVGGPWPGWVEELQRTLATARNVDQLLVLDPAARPPEPEDEPPPEDPRVPGWRRGVAAALGSAGPLTGLTLAGSLAIPLRLLECVLHCPWFEYEGGRWRLTNGDWAAGVVEER